MNPTDSLMTSAEVCDRLGIDRSTLSRWVAAKRITPALKMPGVRGPFLFDPAEVELVEQIKAKHTITPHAVKPADGRTARSARRSA